MEVAARVAWSGAGVNLRQHRPSSDRIKKAVREVLSNPKYRQNAQRMQADMARYDARRQIAEILAQLSTPKSYPTHQAFISEKASNGTDKIAFDQKKS